MLFGDDGDDRLHGGEGDDELEGGEGDDRLHGGDGDDKLEGGEGDDVLKGGDGDDDLDGGEGDDVLKGGDGDDDLDGGEGDDVLKGRDGDDTIDAGDGDDKVWGGRGDDDITGGAGNDWLGGGHDDDTIAGGAWNDDISGGHGDDDISGGDGNDWINAGRGDDDVSGGAGMDRIKGRHGDDTIDAGADNDKVWGGRDDDNISGGAGDDWLGGGHDDDTIAGGAGNDDISGGHGDDEISGGAGDDWINAGRGDDAADGGAGNDWVDADRGDDIANYTMAENLGESNFYDGGRGFDTLQLTLTHGELALANLQQDLADFAEFLAAHANPHSDRGPEFEFATFDLDVEDFEDLATVLTNAGPTAMDDTATIDEDSLLSVAAPGVLANDTDPDHLDVLTVVGHDPTSAAGAAVVLAPDGSFTYDPGNLFQSLAASQSTTDSFGYHAGMVADRTVDPLIPRSGAEGIAWPAVPEASDAIILSLLHQLQQTEWWSPEDLRRHQFTQAERLIAHAFDTVPFYRECLKDVVRLPAGGLSEEVWRTIPILTRVEAQANAEALVSHRVPESHGAVHDERTSGSTGHTARSDTDRRLRKPSCQTLMGQPTLLMGCGRPINLTRAKL